jgi:AcrR family transcriptional regulator
MARTRAAVLRGARECVLRDGTRKTTMVRIAQVAGVAKATLYNHFRAKEEVFAALVDAEVAEAVAELREQVAVAGAHDALVRAAERLGTHPVARRLAETEPGTLARLVLPGEHPGPSWALAREALVGVLGVGHLEAPGHTVELALRWLVSQLLWPSPHEELDAVASLLLATSTPLPPVGSPGGEPEDNGLGFPKVNERIPGVLTEIH